MKRRTHIQLTPYEDLFSTEEQRQDYHREKVMDIPLNELHHFKDHPFKVLDDDRMADTARSVQEHGVLVPAIARPRPDGGYELISGHRRKRACELAGLDTMPVIVREMDDNAAVLVMVDSNIQRENILPSERAFAYKMKLEAIERAKGRPSENVGQVVPYLGKRSTEIVAEGTGESYKQIQRYPWPWEWGLCRRPCSDPAVAESPGQARHAGDGFPPVPAGIPWTRSCPQPPRWTPRPS